MKKIKVILTIAIILAVTGAFSGMYFKVNAKTNDNRISEGIYIESVYIGGMTVEEAEETLAAYVEELKMTEFTLTAGDKQLTFDASEMGLEVTSGNVISEAMSVGKTGSLLKRYKDLTDLEHGDLVLELATGIDTEVVTALLNENIEKIDTKAVNNGLIREEDEFIYVPGTTGIAVNVGPSVALIEEYISTEWNREDATIELSAEITEPKGSEEELAKVQDLLGGYSTNFKTSVAARITNINVATDRINGTVLYPGEEFSVNETILYRSAENGYEMAGSYEGGQTVQSYGGGVCQVSTTLYNAVIRAELEITERQNHSMTVAYVPLAMDAAIAGDYLDFKFKNNTESPIYLEGYTKGKDLYFNIYGEETRPENRTIEFKTVVLSTEDPGTQFTAVELPTGTVTQTQSKHIGYKTQLWKIVKEDGVEVSREKFNTSNYKASPKVLAVGIATDNETLRWKVYNAIASGDVTQIYEALLWDYPEAAAVVLQQ
ncbi:MAG: VanW family protein [Roseburia sp.]|nr:VanW family protein [Roseburia sp.]